MIIEASLRLLAALSSGGIIGIEREWRSKEAGFRTHFLVALGSTLFCIVSQYGFGEDLKDSSRVAAQVVSGVGFLGAGTIIFQKKRGTGAYYGSRIVGDSCHRVSLRDRNVCNCRNCCCHGDIGPGGPECIDSPDRHNQGCAHFYGDFKKQCEKRRKSNKKRLH